MRKYMPKKHSDFLELLENKKFNLKYEIQTRNNIELTKIYNLCVHNLSLLRTTHMNIIHTYIVQFVPELKDTTDTHKTVNDYDGSGGTKPIPFVRSTIQSTLSQKIIIKPKINWLYWWNVILIYLLSIYLVIVLYASYLFFLKI